MTEENRELLLLLLLLELLLDDNMVFNIESIVVYSVEGNEEIY